MTASDMASRIKATLFRRRRHSGAPSSLASTASQSISQLSAMLLGPSQTPLDRAEGEEEEEQEEQEEGEGARAGHSADEQQRNVGEQRCGNPGSPQTDGDGDGDEAEAEDEDKDRDKDRDKEQDKGQDDSGFSTIGAEAGCDGAAVLDARTEEEPKKPTGIVASAQGQQQRQQQRQGTRQPASSQGHSLRQKNHQRQRQRQHQHQHQHQHQQHQGRLGPPGLASPPPGSDLQHALAPPPASAAAAAAAAVLPTTPGLSSLSSIDEDEPPTSPPSPPHRHRHSHRAPPSSLADARDSGHDDDASLRHGQPGSAPLPSSLPLSLPLPLPLPPRPVSPLSVSVQTPSPAPSSASPARPPAPLRRQSLVSNRHASFIQSLLQTPLPTADAAPGGPGPGPDNPAVAPAPGSPVVFSSRQRQTLSLPVFDAAMAMAMRKIWVKRPHASATLITIRDHDLVDDVRDMILRKYANSLGRTFDSPDLTIRITPRDTHKERVLSPEEPISDAIDSYFPGGQMVGEALVIDVPRRTPKASPRVPHPHSATIYFAGDGRPSEAGEGYFPPVAGAPSPHLPNTVPATADGGAVPNSMSVLGSGHLPPIPSPGGTRSRAYRERQDRPRLGRTHTSSPNLHNGGPASISSSAANAHGMQHYHSRHSHSRTHSSSSEHAGLPTAATPLAKSPGPEPSPARMSTPPPPRLSSPRLSNLRPKKGKKAHPEYQSIIPSNVLNGSVPPISVLIVEDNPINLKLLEAFVKRLKVRWQTAMNGRDAVKKWRTGGFHLVLMDIQLPVMNGLDATREIRRLERVNNIGVFSSTPGSLPEEPTPSEAAAEQDRLQNTLMFKSSVIIVALTASSLQSDRHEALAAGCNDFLTKPVNFVWLERKVMEWGCMQALIDFDGWRKWKDFSHAEEMEANKRAQAAKAKSKKSRSSVSALAA